MTLGYPILVALTALSVVASFAVAMRAKCRGRAELLLATSMIWNFLIIAPIYVLGLSNRLQRGRLAVTSAAWFLTVLFAALYQARDTRAFLRLMWQTAGELARLPFEGIALALRRRSLVAIALVLAPVVVLWTMLMTWYCASWGQWDSLWYHEPMIGFTIQNHGFAFVDLPADVQKINGYPRLVEMTQLWFVIFTDRRLVEILNSLMAPALILAVYLLCRRYTKDTVHAMGWGASIVLMPFVSNLFQTTYVDVMTAIYVLAAVYWATHDELRLSDVLLASVCLALAIGSKLMAIVPVGIVSLVAIVRVVRLHASRRPWGTVGVIVVGAALIGGIAASTFLRNYLKYHNPLWPDFRYDNERFNIHWPGSTAWTKSGALSMNLPMTRLLEDLYSIPYSKTGSYYYESFDYGFSVPWLVLPVATIGLLAAVASVVGAIASRLTGQTLVTAKPETRNLVLVSVPALAMLYTMPALWAARYNIASVGIMMAIVSWVSSRKGMARFGESAVGIHVVAATIMFFWAQPRWWYTPAELGKSMNIPYPTREFTPQSQISATLWLARGSAITTPLGLAREAEIGPGDIVAFDDEYGGFPALFWNNRYTNKIVYVPTAHLVDGAEKAGAKWVYCHYSDYNISRLRAADSGWQEIGTWNVEGWGAMFRRVKK